MNERSSLGPPARPEIVLVAALGRNRVIGVDGEMPWHLPADLAHFKQVTLGHPVIMGRATFESIGRPLPGRRNLVLSRSWSEAPSGVECARSLDEALDRLDAEVPAMVIGGGQLYAEALPRAAAMELTLVDARPEGDTRFPAWRRVDWRLRSMEAHPADGANPHRMIFLSLIRNTPVEWADDD
ncbi:dihydrofolate reductase [Halomonas denitrificans]|nr:dihydrofolate reductase [Halomonas denitrificans]